MPGSSAHKFFFTLLFLSLSFHLKAQNVYFEWAEQCGGPNGSPVAESIVTDPAGNVYITGYFSGTVDFDPGPAVFNMSTVNTWDRFTYVVKLNAAGGFVWAKYIKGDGGNYSSNTAGSIAIDPQGNVLVTGRFGGTADFDPGPGSYLLTSPNQFGNAFVFKLTADGDLIWAKKFGATGIDYSVANAVTVDASANIYTTGFFTGLIDFDPGNNNYPLQTTFDAAEIFISKLDAAGNFVWAKRMAAITPANSLTSQANSIVLDASGNIYTAGVFNGSVDFDPGTAVYNLDAADASGFISKLDPSGNFIWAKEFTAASNSRAICNSIRLDAAGNIYTAGNFEGMIDFDPGNETYNLDNNSGGYTDVFISKLDNAGNFTWVKQVGGINYDFANELAIDAFENVYIMGSFSGTCDFDPGPGVHTLTANSAVDDNYISKLDSSGSFLWVARLGSNSSNVHNAVTFDVAGNMYSTGIFIGTADFDPGPAIYNLYSLGNGGDAVFIHKMSPCTNKTYSTLTKTVCNTTYTLNDHVYSSSGTYMQTILNTDGCDSIITLKLILGGSKTIFNAQACTSYTWNGHTYSASGNYSDTLVDVNGCDSILSLQLLIDPVSYSYSNISICPGENYAGHTSAGLFKDTLVAANGCDSIHVLNLTIKNCIPFIIPNAFTPNADGHNDIFRPIITLDIRSYSFTIFNRYGQKVFDTRDHSKGWNGTYKGWNQPPGSYVYYIRYTTADNWPVEEKGTFLLLR